MFSILKKCRILDSYCRQHAIKGQLKKGSYQNKLRHIYGYSCFAPQNFSSCFFMLPFQIHIFQALRTLWEWIKTFSSVMFTSKTFTYGSCKLLQTCTMLAVSVSKPSPIFRLFFIRIKASSSHNSSGGNITMLVTWCSFFFCVNPMHFSQSLNVNMKREGS